MITRSPTTSTGRWRLPQQVAGQPLRRQLHSGAYRGDPARPFGMLQTPVPATARAEDAGGRALIRGFLLFCHWRIKLCASNSFHRRPFSALVPGSRDAGQRSVLFDRRTSCPASGRGATTIRIINSRTRLQRGLARADTLEILVSTRRISSLMSKACRKSKWR